MRWYLIVAISLSLAYRVKSQAFEDITPVTGLGAGWLGNLVFGDVDQDGDADLIIGRHNGTTVHFNDQLNFSRFRKYNEFKQEFQVFQNIDVGDINLDGQLDVLQTGESNIRVLNVLLNRNLEFVNLNESFPGIAGSSSLLDFDSDGDLDIVYAGTLSGLENVAGVLLFQDGSLIKSSIQFLNQNSRFVAAADINRDSQIEILQSSQSNNPTQTNFLLQKDPTQGFFQGKPMSKMPSTILGASFADLDGDGDLDLLAKDNNWIFKIYHFENGEYVPTAAQFPLARMGVLADMNGDGFYDVILAGVEETFQIFETRIYLSNGGNSYTKLANTGLVGSYQSAIALADIDRDGDLDLALAGNDNTFQFQVDRIYVNHISDPSQRSKPSPPANLVETVNNSEVQFEWSVGQDDKTSTNRLTYNIFVRGQDGSIIVPAHSSSDGTRIVTKMGNAFGNTSYRLTCLKAGTYYWSVQTLDAEYNGSPFAAERSFTIANNEPKAPGSLATQIVSDREIVLHWNDMSGNETSYIVSRRAFTESTWFNFPPLPQNANRFVDTLQLLPDTEYEYNVVAANCSYRTQFAASVKAKTMPPLFRATNWLQLGQVEFVHNTLLGDFDSDQDLDLLITFSNSNFFEQTRLYRFTPTGYVDTGFEFPLIDAENRPQWIDVDADGYLDLCFNGGHFGALKPRFLLNKKGSGFTEVFPVFNIPSYSMWKGGMVWGDLDHDGDDDLLIQLQVSIDVWRVRLFENQGNLLFSERSDFNFPIQIKSNQPLGDYDNDGDLDILVSRFNSCNISSRVGILENTGSAGFDLKMLNIAGLNNDFLNFSGEWKWGDFNGDGYDDIIMAGNESCNSGSPFSKVLINTKNKNFVEQPSNMIKRLFQIQLEPGDFNNDGTLDVVLYGVSFSDPPNTRLYDNVNGKFTDSKIEYLPASYQGGVVSKGDIDHDGDLDLVVPGLEGNRRGVTIFQSLLAEAWQRPNTPPEAPKNLQALVNDGQVQLRWDPAIDTETPSPSLTYQTYLIRGNDTIEVSGSNTTGVRKVARQGSIGHTTTRQFQKLISGRYRWSVQAIDGGFQGSRFSPEQTFIIPEKPTARAASSITPRTFVANWSSNSGNVMLDVSADNFITYLPGYRNKLITINSDSIKGLLPLTRYYYRVRGLNEWGTSSVSNVIELVTSELPQITANPATSITPFSFVAHWGSIPNAESYSLDVSIDNFVSFLPGYNNRQLDRLSDTLKNLFPETQYRYRVRANFKFGPTANSNTIDVTTAVLPRVIATSATLINPVSFVAHWSSIPEAISYSLDVSSDSFTTFIQGYQNKLITGLFDTVENLNPEVHYQYRVRANFVYGASMISNTIEVSTPPLPLLLASNATFITPISFLARWTDVPGVINYSLDVSTDNFVTFLEGYHRRTILSNKDTIVNLAPETKYQYRVQAHLVYGKTIHSNAIQAETLEIPKPVAQPASDATENSFIANWSASGAALRYLLDISTDNFVSFLSGYNGKEILDLRQEVDGLQPLTEFFYRVRAVTKFGTSKPSNTIIASTLITSHETTNAEISIYPNPAKDVLFVLGHFESLQVIDTNGRSVEFSNEVGKEFVKLTISALAPGLYLLRARFSNRVETVRFVKQ